MDLILVVAAFGQTWSNNTFDISWGTASNWTSATVPYSAGATATFNAVNNTTYGVVLSGGPFTVGTLNLNNDVPGGFAFQLGTLRLAGAATINVQSHNFGPDFFANTILALKANA